MKSPPTIIEQGTKRGGGSDTEIRKNQGLNFDSISYFKGSNPQKLTQRRIGSTHCPGDGATRLKMHSWPFHSLGGFDKAWSALGAVSFHFETTETTMKTHPNVFNSDSTHLPWQGFAHRLFWNLHLAWSLEHLSSRLLPNATQNSM